VSSFQPYTRTFRPESALDPNVEYTVFSVAPDFVDVLTSVPLDAEWVYYMLLPSSAPDVPETHAFPLVAFAFHVVPTSSAADQIGNVTGRGWYFAYGGLPPPSLQNYSASDGVALECTQDLAVLSGGLCQYDLERKIGDFMLFLGTFLLVLRERLDDPDLQALSVQTTAQQRTIQWRIPSYNFLQVDDLRVRYAVKPVSYVANSMVSDLPYHGLGHTAHVAFTLADRPDDDDGQGTISMIQPNTSQGFIQHSSVVTVQTDGGSAKTTWNVGGDFGWNNPPPGTIRYEDLVVPPGTILRFSYGFLLFVVRVADPARWESCDLSNITQLGEPTESQLDLTLQELGDYFFSSTEKTCQNGLKLHVVVQDENEPDEDTTTTVDNARPMVEIPDSSTTTAFAKSKHGLLIAVSLLLLNKA
jgi:hypothetical protein